MVNPEDYSCPIAFMKALGEIDGVEYKTDNGNIHLVCNSVKVEKLVKKLMDEHLRLHPECYQIEI